MKRKLLKICLAAVLSTLLLGGCKNFGEYSEPNDRRLVSVIGFDNQNGDIRATAEALEATESGSVQPYLLAENGKSAHEALTRISAQSPRELSFTHCSALILGKELTAEQIEDILDYCTGEKNISLSAKVISADNAEQILSVKAEAAVSAGFEVADITENTAERFGYGGHCALYEIKTARMQTANIYALPFFEGWQEKLRFEGLRVYVNDTVTALLNGEESLSYAVMRNIYDGGEVFYRDNIYTLDSASSKVRASFENGRLRLDVSVYSHGQNEKLSEIIQSTAESFDTDIFGIANTIEARYPEIFDKIKADYSTYYKNAEIIIREE